MTFSVNLVLCSRACSNVFLLSNDITLYPFFLSLSYTHTHTYTLPDVPSEPLLSEILPNFSKDVLQVSKGLIVGKLVCKNKLLNDATNGISGYGRVLIR